MQGPDVTVRGWSIDSRAVQNGDLFFAIKGERHDGHAFTRAALKHGAVAAVVSEPVGDEKGTLLEVSDTVEALQQLAHWARWRWGRPMVADNRQRRENDDQGCDCGTIECSRFAWVRRQAI